MKIDSVLKVADIQSHQLSPSLVKYLKEDVQETYTDRVLNEHIYNIEDVHNEYGEKEDCDPDVLGELETILKICNRYKAAYFRIIQF